MRSGKSYYQLIQSGITTFRISQFYEYIHTGFCYIVQKIYCFCFLY